MDGHKHEELSDALLEREIESALDVDPSPEFLARVRTRIASDRVDESWAWLGGWRLAGAALTIVAVAVFGFWIAHEPVPAPGDGRLVTALHDLEPIPGSRGIEVPAHSEPGIPGPVSVPDVTASSNAVTPVVMTARDKGAPEPPLAQPEVMISQDEAAALRQLFAAISDRRIETAALPDLQWALKPPSPIEEIVLEPITISPLATLEGE